MKTVLVPTTVFCCNYFVNCQLVALPISNLHPYDDINLSGINYVGQQGELRGCQNDVLNVSQWQR